MGEYLFRAVDIHKYFAGVRALDGVTLEIKPGEIHCLAGENGCGKSTLIKVISGVYQRNSGTLEFDGEVIEKMTPIDAIMKGIQVIYQDFAVFPNLSVMENLAINSQLAAKKKFVNWKEMRNIAKEAIAKIDFEVDLDAKLETLSVAEKQMVAICRALMFNARLIIMDEPTTALTKKEVQALFKIIMQLKAEGIAILFVSHKLDEVFEIAERFTVFRNGKLIKTGYTSELDDKKFSYYMTGREFENKTFIPDKLTGQPVLEVKDISLSGCYEDISFTVKGGEIMGITGLLDSGRTELALSLFGMKPIEKGEIQIHGSAVEINNPQAAIENKIGFVPEDRLSEGLFLTQSIGDNIVISEIDHLISKGILNREKYQEEVKRWVAELSIATPNPDNAASTLSGGNQQRIVLAKWLACNPDILILNGPTVGVDIGSKHDIHGILQKLARQGMAIIIISDDLPEVMENCSKILILKDGKISGQLSTQEIDEKMILDRMM
ncbi:sugar ABC transporter ATP-binding protein [Faecalicatena contorta]|uniref:Monosaccharide ABC transporter ATP-binding protein, CUT2 family n=1 Tax=Faecalicatena contorta TaxID=39482 RepID=A0A315ZUF2_9FIRM|nr:sugar ABC transporter ATP-binding protein [Faecalicatena contorta]PWJ48952.1 monosaccharide ABC transporter ATP-binding protein (CUT2 family) [Faecalicatena contorta]SUQ15042.1 monosaccharide ABC transporter ATP-binding protein, CUT2 family [Faecalicatena contorta]